jgi:hypothetical protein
MEKKSLKELDEEEDDHDDDVLKKYRYCSCVEFLFSVDV